MRTHFIVLLVGSVLFLVRFILQTWDVIVWSSEPGGAADRNTANLLRAMQLLGVYVVFAVLVLGHGLLSGRPVRRPPESEVEPDATHNRGPSGR